MKPRLSPTPTPTLGSVRSDEIMPKREYCRRMAVTKSAWAELRRRGFPFVQVGKQVYVDGAAAVAWFRALADRQAGDNCDGGPNHAE
jgi:hypothetical protein